MNYLKKEHIWNLSIHNSFLFNSKSLFAQHCFYRHFSALNICNAFKSRSSFDDILISAKESETLNSLKTSFVVQSSMNYLIATFVLKPAFSAFRFEKSEVKNVCVNLKPYSLQSSFLEFKSKITILTKFD